MPRTGGGALYARRKAETLLPSSLAHPYGIPHEREITSRDGILSAILPRH
jgi:hypothetical protein